MDRYLGMKYFAKVVETRSFSTCARIFGVTPSSVTRVIGGLEGELGITLLHRSTRQVLPTEAGKSYFNSIRRLLTELDEAALEAISLGNEPKGTLRISAPSSFGALRLGPLLPRFLAKFPKIRVETHLTDEFVDLLSESIDVSIRVGIHNKESSLKMTKIEHYRRALCASPAYLKKHGVPKSIGDLRNHQFVTFYSSPENIWYFKLGGKIQEFEAKGRLVVNSLEACILAAKAGQGIILPSYWSVAQDLKSGKLVEILPSIPTDVSPDFDQGLYAVYVGQKAAPKVRVFIDFIKEEFRKQYASG